MMLMSDQDTLPELFSSAPAGDTAILLPDSGIRITYQQLRDQVAEMADELASLGIRPGDRVATYLTERIAGDCELSLRRPLLALPRR